MPRYMLLLAQLAPPDAVARRRPSHESGTRPRLDRLAIFSHYVHDLIRYPIYTPAPHPPLQVAPPSLSIHLCSWIRLHLCSFHTPYHPLLRKYVHIAGSQPTGRMRSFQIESPNLSHLL
ncbi:hypothetical protein P691DRAFT_39155 [Macrolepiota fuliginosa MF-IS2]|uniref:Uncharacterized protein n=1 Tax=Macrolepiota fuliginosa MF-IS2 TaxID=1400762 RepID=A0A9P6BWR4_9AGAR|nr:hypothetical protein P691DRAFT_39155 [Macrolepiota fuliginosa MF-IS2]